MDGFILINKERGWTSRDVCTKISHMLNVKKVGHIGTLDPFAEGLLLVMLGNATKTSFLFDDFSKEYKANLILGKKTTTGDVMGDVIEEKQFKFTNKDNIEAVISSFLGEYHQVPPMTSAIHYNGVKLYRLAHQGIEVKRESRIVKINSISINNVTDDSITFTSDVSKGTYIRVLGEDIAAKFNTVGYLDSLIRTRIGPLKLSDSRVTKVLDVNDHSVISIADLLSFIPSIILPDMVIGKVKNGMTLNLNKLNKSEKVIILDKDKNAIALYQHVGQNNYKCIRGLWN